MPHNGQFELPSRTKHNRRRATMRLEFGMLFLCTLGLAYLSYWLFAEYRQEHEQEWTPKSATLSPKIRELEPSSKSVFPKDLPSDSKPSIAQPIKRNEKPELIIATPLDKDDAGAPLVDDHYQQHAVRPIVHSGVSEPIKRVFLPMLGNGGELYSVKSVFPDDGITIAKQYSSFGNSGGKMVIGSLPQTGAGGKSVVENSSINFNYSPNGKAPIESGKSPIQGGKSILKNGFQTPEHTSDMTFNREPVFDISSSANNDFSTAPPSLPMGIANDGIPRTETTKGEYVSIFRDPKYDEELLNRFREQSANPEISIARPLENATFRAPQGEGPFRPDANSGTSAFSQNASTPGDPSPVSVSSSPPTISPAESPLGIGPHPDIKPISPVNNPSTGTSIPAPEETFSRVSSPSNNKTASIPNGLLTESAPPATSSHQSISVPGNTGTPAVPGSGSRIGPPSVPPPVVAGGAGAAMVGSVPSIIPGPSGGASSTAPLSTPGVPNFGGVNSSPPGPEGGSPNLSDIPSPSIGGEGGQTASATPSITSSPSSPPLTSAPSISNGGDFPSSNPGIVRTPNPGTPIPQSTGTGGIAVTPALSPPAAVGAGAIGGAVSPRPITPILPSNGGIPPVASVPPPPTGGDLPNYNPGIGTNPPTIPVTPIPPSNEGVSPGTPPVASVPPAPIGGDLPNYNPGIGTNPPTIPVTPILPSNAGISPGTPPVASVPPAPTGGEFPTYNPGGGTNPPVIPVTPIPPSNGSISPVAPTTPPVTSLPPASSGGTLPTYNPGVGVNSPVTPIPPTTGGAAGGAPVSPPLPPANAPIIPTPSTNPTSEPGREPEKDPRLKTLICTPWTVQPGQTIESLAQSTGSSPADIREINGITSIRPGQTIRLPIRFPIPCCE